MDTPEKDRWIVCFEYANGPFTPAAAGNRLDHITRSEDPGMCKLPHTIVISDKAPVTAAQQEQQDREAAEAAHESRFFTDENEVPCRSGDI